MWPNSHVAILDELIEKLFDSGFLKCGRKLYSLECTQRIEVNR
jgi:hypothetical protein